MAKVASLGTAPQSSLFANSTPAPGAVPGVAQTSTLGTSLFSQPYRSASISVPKPQTAPDTSRSFYNQQITVPPPTGNSGSGAAPGFVPTSYNGKVYNDQASYNAAVLADAQTAHDAAVQNTNKAFQNGLITFDQRQKALELSRSQLANQISNLAYQDQQSRDQVQQGLTSALQNNAGFFAAASPDAYQSYQKTLEQKAQDAASTGIAGLDQAKKSNDLAVQGASQGIEQGQTALDQGRQDFYGGFVNAVGTGQARALGGGDAGLSAYLANAPQAAGTINQDLAATGDKLKNSELALQDQIRRFSAAQSQQTAANTKSYDPTAVLSDLAGYHVGLVNNGASPEQARQATLFAAGQTYGQNNLAGIQQALYGTDPNSQQGSFVQNFVNAKLSPPTRY